MVLAGDVACLLVGMCLYAAQSTGGGNAVILIDSPAAIKTRTSGTSVGAASVTSSAQSIISARSFHAN